MADTMSKAQRSALMSRIRGKNTKPEMIVRSIIHRLGYRFRLHAKGLPGTPDLVLPRLRTVVFVHGCFWHRHAGCVNCTVPKTRRRFWNAKFKATLSRDAKSITALVNQRWRVLVIWECDTEDPERLAARLLQTLHAANHHIRQIGNGSLARAATRR